MSLDCLKLFIIQLVIQSNPIFPGQITCGVCEKPNMLVEAKLARYFLY